MNQENQGNGPDSSSNIFIKRKRGRPRKDQSQTSGRIANVSTRDQIQARPEQAHVPPGFERTNGSHPREGNTVINNGDAIVGQTVTGVIEAAFDAGYLLSIRVDNSDTNLRGVVFKPGHFVPISMENDVAPNIQMIRRSAVPSPADYHTPPVHGSYRRGRGRGRAKSESRMAFSANGSSSNQLTVYNDNPSSLVGNRGSVVPVVLQPCTNPSTAATPIVETPSNATVQTIQTETTQIEKGPDTDNGALTKPVDESNGSTTKLPSGLMEELVNDAGQRTEGPSQPKEIPEPVQDLKPPSPVKTFQAIWSDPPSVPQNLRDARAGKMTELLMAVQENLIENHAADEQHSEYNQRQN